MAKIILLTDKDIVVSSCSGSKEIRIASSELIQNYNFIMDNVDVTGNTSVAYEDFSSTYPETPYVYKLFYYYDENRSATYKTIFAPFTINILTKTDSESLEGTFTQYGNPNAPYIKNIKVYDSENILLNKDSFNRWIISNKYPEGSEFKLEFDASYPTSYSVWPNVNLYDSIGENFIDEVWLVNKTTAKLKINDVIDNTNTSMITFDYDDFSSIGNCFTQVLFARDGIMPVILTADTLELSNLSYEEGNYEIGITYSNIEESQLHTSVSDNWLSATISNSKLLVSVDSNMLDTSETRNASIKIYGTNDEGTYNEITIYISQIALNSPYIGDAVETYNNYPLIRVKYNGDVVKETSIFTLYNVKDDLGNDLVDSVYFYIKDNKTDFLHYEYLEGTHNGKIYSNIKYNKNYIDVEQIDLATVEINLINGKTINSIIVILTEPSPENVIGPIWKDYYFKCEKKYFRIRNLETNETIYNGIVYPKASNIVRINDILKNYIAINKYPFEKTISFNNCMINVIIDISDTPLFEYYDELKIYHLYWNYSYNYSANDEDMMGEYSSGYYCEHSGIDIDTNFANPIEYYDYRQHIFITISQNFMNYNANKYVVYGYDEETSKLTTIDYLEPNKFIGDLCTFTITPGNYDKIQLHQEALPEEDPDHGYLWECGKLKCTKANYAVYYLNNAGIWCWMLFEGKQLESIKTTLNKFLNDSYNDISYNIHTETYKNNIEESYSLTSLYLTDKQSKMLKDLYTSPLIYVHELDNNLIYNVYLGTTTMDIKTYNNQGRKRFTHNIKLIKSMNKEIQI